MSAATRAAIEALAQRLARAHAELDRHFESAPELLAARPAPNGWSPAEVLEHVALTSRYLLVLVRKLAEKSRRRSARGDALPESPPTFEHLDHLAGREFHWDCPEHMQPRGQVTLAEVRRQLAQQADEIAALLNEFAGGSGSLHSVRLSLLDANSPEGDHLDLYQYLHFLGLHIERHLAQLARGTAEPGRL